MPKTVTVTLVVDPNNPSQTRPSYDPGNRVWRGDFVVFKVQGSTAVFTVNFPDGSPFGASVPSLQVGGPTLADQSTPPETVAQVPFTRYGFVATPNSSTSPAPKPHPEDPDTPGTATGDLEVVPETGGV
jgi:hypothetical protein